MALPLRDPERLDQLVGRSTVPKVGRSLIGLTCFDAGRLRWCEGFENLKSTQLQIYPVFSSHLVTSPSDPVKHQVNYPTAHITSNFSEVKCLFLFLVESQFSQTLLLVKFIFVQHSLCELKQFKSKVTNYHQKMQVINYHRIRTYT